ncbi:DUF2817 domain-containing protein [Psychroserpens burtonensis]|uniref:DUF2817 domain-containing protein n=1 Tax=Psychroserpens burtonensis TaxID=49278 RepID=A0A5C7BAN3_9FLAO|nr:M14 family zinc carboxypeptidase [Psychroserpens burtonensis]TXE15653.1 DUF2817 domain-containing protein [Psychroserpens burtonensis]
MENKTLKALFETHKESSLFGRYIHSQNIAPLLDKMKDKMRVIEVGNSVDGLPIYSITFGSGKKKILMWSQMHGNESTTTKAVFDMLNIFLEENHEIEHILTSCSICIIPILNPDGAKLYTRFNANKIDLNRDAKDLSQPESIVLRKVFEDFAPDFCYNLHGQRTIFSAGNTNKSATVSFLSPSQNPERTITTTRKKAMEVISVMNVNLQQQIENQVGIYDDSFNINCVGDAFQASNVPTILFEAGHYANDYYRERTREFIFQSLIISLDYIASNTITGDYCGAYFNIPQNEKRFYDIVIRNVKGSDIAIHYLESLVGNVLVFVPKIERISDLSGFFGHKEIDANGSGVFGESCAALKVGDEIDFVMVNDEKFSFKV